MPPAHACNRGLCMDGLGSVLSGLMGAPVGLCSSVPNACVIGLSQVRDCIDAFTIVLLNFARINVVNVYCNISS